jgi:glutathione peroxidase
MASEISKFEALDILGKNVPLKNYEGKTLLIVNVASHCGFTPQYKGLENLYRKFKDKNFVVLGFPCNQFGAQESGSEDEIKSFCSLTYDITFPLFSKVNVNGPEAHPLFQYLKKEEKGVLGTEAIKWNFTKFLVSKTGEVLKRFAPTTSPEAIEKEIERIL